MSPLILIVSQKITDIIIPPPRKWHFMALIQLIVHMKQQLENDSIFMTKPSTEKPSREENLPCYCFYFQ